MSEDRQDDVSRLQAAEARERHVLERLLCECVLSEWDEETKTWGRATFDADKLVRIQEEVVALSVRLAQAEQQITTDAHTFREWRCTIERLEVRLREYEEALKEIEHYGNRGDWHNDIARAALAASGGREAS